MAGWLGLRLRQLLFVLPALCIAVSQARLSPVPGAAARTAAAAAVVAAWASQHPAELAATMPSLHPWLRLSAVEGVMAMALATGCASLVGVLQLAGLHLLSAALPAKAARCSGTALTCLGAAAIAASSVVHPALTACCGGLCLALRLAARGKAAGQPSPCALAWLMYYGQLALLPCVGLYSWLVSSGRQWALPWTDGRALVLALALHALLLRCGSDSGAVEGGRARGQGSGGSGRALVRAALHEASAAVGTVACLLGHPFVLVYTACASAAAQL